MKGRSRDYDEFETELNSLAERVSALIDLAPPFQENWPTVNPDIVRITQLETGEWTYTLRHSTRESSGAKNDREKPPDD